MEDKDALIKAAWRRTLPESVATDDENFFELGGTSLAAATFVSELREQGIRVPLSVVFESGKLADVITQAKDI